MILRYVKAKVRTPSFSLDSVVFGLLLVVLVVLLLLLLLVSLLVSLGFMLVLVLIVWMPNDTRCRHADRRFFPRCKNTLNTRHYDGGPARVAPVMREAIAKGLQYSTVRISLRQHALVC